MIADNITPLRPSITETDASALQLDSYVMHIKSQECRHCNAEACWSELYEVWTHPTKTGVSALNVLRPTATLQGLPISYIALPIQSVPICAECVIGLSTDNLPRPLPAASRQAWSETLRRKAQSELEAKKEATRAASRVNIPSLGDL